MNQQTAQVGEAGAAAPGGEGAAAVHPFARRGASAAAGVFAAVARRQEPLLKLLAMAITLPMVLVFFYKYLPDYAFEEIAGVPRMLQSYELFWREMMNVGTYPARFASYYLQIYTARAIEAVIGMPGDPRFHPLRLAAEVITTVSLWVAAAPTLLDRTGRWDWRVFYGGLLALTAMSLYLFLPFDFPALALISLGLVALLHKKRALAMVLLLVCGMFRENNIHIAWFAVSTLAVPALSVGYRWAAAYVAAFLAEYWLLRKVIFPYRDNDITWVIYQNLISPGSWMIVFIVLAMAAIGFVVVAGRMGRARRWDPLDVFFMIQFLMVPVWLTFYLVNGSNWSEFRIQLPSLLPVLYAVAYRPAPGGWTVGDGGRAGDGVEGGAAAPSAV